jgi:hypothetical protein
MLASAAAFVASCGGQIAGDPTAAGTDTPIPAGPAPTSLPEPPKPAPAPTTTAPAPNDRSTYEAHGYIGGIDRLTIVKRDPVRDLCFAVQLAGVGGAGTFGITAPFPWQAQAAWAAKGASTCRSPGQTTVSATKGAGSVAFGPGNPYPCTVDVDVTLAFARTPPGIPPAEPLRAKNVFVDGFCARDAGAD